jgi:hypothetical protein
MYSAFSFGKIIKTILPGSILAGTLFLIAETLWSETRGTSLLATLIEKEAVAVAGAALVPVSLILGFLLNTVVWLYLNASVRSRAKAELARTPFAELREALCDLIRQDVNLQIGVTRAELCKDTWPEPLSLEYYFLPAIGVERLSYLWESYFSWYEFHLNTLCALAIASAAVVVALLLGSPASGVSTAIICVAVASVCGLLCRVLWKSAIRNMAAYERNLVLLIAGSIKAAGR